MRERSNLISSPGDPITRKEFGACTNEVNAGNQPGRWVNVNVDPVSLWPARSNGTPRNLLDLRASMVNRGTASWDDRCWFGIGSHAGGGHEPGDDLSKYQSNDGWRSYLAAPGPARFRLHGRFIVTNGGAPSFGHDRSGVESQNDGPHTTNLTEVRFTPFRKSRLPQEIEKLRRLR